MIFQIDKTIYEQLSETERYIVDLLAKMKTKFLISPLQILPIKHFHPQPQYLEQFKNVVLRESQNCVI